MTTHHTPDTQIAVRDIESGAIPVAVSRGLGGRVKDLFTVDPDAAKIIRAHQAQRAEDLAHGAELPEGIAVTATMQERAQAINDLPEQHS